MLIAVIVGLAFGLALVGFLLFSAARSTSMPRELQGDWWSQFEREFRAYARRMTPHDPPPQS